MYKQYKESSVYNGNSLVEKIHVFKEKNGVLYYSTSQNTRYNRFILYIPRHSLCPPETASTHI